MLVVGRNVVLVLGLGAGVGLVGSVTGVVDCSDAVVVRCLSSGVDVLGVLTRGGCSEGWAAGDTESSFKKHNISSFMAY